MSNPVQSNVKSGETARTGRIQRALWFQSSFHPRWTVPGTKSDSCQTGYGAGFGQCQLRNRTVVQPVGTRPGDGSGAPAVLRAKPLRGQKRSFMSALIRRGVFGSGKGVIPVYRGLGVGGGLSNAVQLNLKSGEIGPYRRYSASNWVPEQLPAPLDSARNEIGQCATSDSGQCWTAPATESDSLSSRLESGWAGWLAGPGDGVWRAWAGGADG